MSLTYYPNNKIEPYCDSQYTFGLPIDGQPGDKVWHRPSYVLVDEFARSAANKLSEVSDGILDFVIARIGFVLFLVGMMLILLDGFVIGKNSWKFLVDGTLIRRLVNQ